MAGWKVWGDPSEPYLTDVDEETAKQWVVDRAKSMTDLYVEDPEGNELVYQDGNWTEL